MQIDSSIYPKDFFIKISEEENLIGRVTVNKNAQGFFAEIDIILKESMKIWRHIGIVQHYEDEREAVESGVQSLSSFLKQSVQ